jgi:tRNA-specific 2-thiouridylase
VSSGAEQLSSHLERPLARGRRPAGGHTGAAGGAACGDLIRITVALERGSGNGRIADVGFDASGCGATVAAGSAVVALIRGRGLLDAARVGAAEIEHELGGLSAAKRHAADLAADALHRALGSAARDASLERRDGRVVVAMSGGVDSAVAALLAARRGGEPVGVTLELWSDPDNDGEQSCCSAEAVRGARALAHELGMPHLSIDLRAEFRAGVVDPWLADHAAGLTPNPCVRCNGSVRLDAMVELAARLGAGTLATGHYARVKDGLLRTAVDEAKDQSYVLAALAPDTLVRLRFPLGAMRKGEVRELARQAGLSVAGRRESQDLCFLAGTRHDAFLARHGGLGTSAGPILDRRGRVLGEHAGAHAYTVGQRHGLGLSAPRPLYVLATDARANTVTVGAREELLTPAFDAHSVTLRRPAGSVDGVRLRAHGRTLPARVPGDLAPGSHELVRIDLASPAERTAPGQIACLYAGDLVVGVGTVASPAQHRA